MEEDDSQSTEIYYFPLIMFFSPADNFFCPADYDNLGPAEPTVGALGEAKWQKWQKF